MMQVAFDVIRLVFQLFIVQFRDIEFFILQASSAVIKNHQTASLESVEMRFAITEISNSSITYININDLGWHLRRQWMVRDRVYRFLRRPERDLKIK